MSLQLHDTPQAKNMLVQTRNPKRNPYSSSDISATNNNLQQSGSDSIKNEVWQVTLWWTLNGNNSKTCMHIWLVDFKAILHKASFA